MQPNRRTLIKGIGTAGLAGLAGCTSLGGGGSGGGDASNPKIGLMAPFSGAYATAGNYVRKATEAAIEQAKNDGLVEDVDLMTKGSELDARTAKSNAREFINNGANLVMSGITGSVMRAGASVCDQRQIISFGMGSSFETEIGSCYEYLFKTGWTIPQHAEGSIGWALRNDKGTRVYDITSNFSWGTSMSRYLSDYLISDVGGEVVGNPVVPVGTSEYGQYLNEASSKDTDILQLNVYGSDAISAINQAYDLGTLDEMTVLISVMTPSMMNAATDAAVKHPNLYYNVSWLPFEKQESQDFFEFYNNNFNDVPAVPPQEITWHYTSVYTYLKAVSEAGTVNSDEMFNQLAGRSLEPAIWPYDTRWREDDHMLMSPAITMQGKADGKIPFGQDQVVNVIDDPSRLAFSKDETACDLA